MKLSLIVHANKDRGDRVQCLLTRLTLNKHLHPWADFEVIVFDGGSSDNTKDICEFMAKVLDLKYIFNPSTGPADETFPISVAAKVAIGDVVGFVSADHWISENLVRDMLHPFEDEGTSVVVGRIARSEDSPIFSSPVQMVDQLLNDKCSNKELEDIMRIAEVSSVSCNTPEVWAALRRELPEQWTYQWQQELLGRCGVINSTETFAIDMWTPPQSFCTVPEEQLGQLEEYGYAVIDGKVLEREELEEWCEQRS